MNGIPRFRLQSQHLPCDTTEGKFSRNNGALGVSGRDTDKKRTVVAQFAFYLLFAFLHQILHEGSIRFLVLGFLRNAHPYHPRGEPSSPYITSHI